jgi:hypothetical protein
MGLSQRPRPLRSPRRSDRGTSEWS